MTQAPIGVGIAGLGRSGWDIHARLLEPMADRYRIVSVLDADPDRRQEAIDRFDCVAHTAYADLLGDAAVELVVVALPSHLHADSTIAALAAGKHVVCEKPMATSLADADRMLAAVQPGGPLLTVFQNRRYSPDFRQIQAVIASGVLGRIVQIRVTASNFGRRWDWQTLKQYGGGSLNNTGPHFIDLALQLFGPAEPQVACRLDRTLTLGDADDYVKVILTGVGAPLVDIEISACDPFPGQTWHLQGTQGGLAGSMQQLGWKYIDPAVQPPRQLDSRPTPNRTYNRDELTFQEGTWDAASDTGPGFSGFYLDLFESIRRGRPLAITPESVRRVMWVLEECHRRSPV